MHTVKRRILHDSTTYQRLAASLLVLLVLSARALYIAAPSLAAPPTAGAASIGVGMLCALGLLGTAGARPRALYSNMYQHTNTGWTPVNVVKRMVLLVLESVQSLLRFNNSPLVGSFYSMVTLGTTAAVALLLGPSDSVPQLAALAGTMGTVAVKHD